MKLLSAKLWPFKEGNLHVPHFSNAQILGMEFGIGIDYIVVVVVGHKQLYKSFFYLSVCVSKFPNILSWPTLLNPIKFDVEDTCNLAFLIASCY